MIEQVTAHVEKVIRTTLKLGDDVTLQPNSDLVNEIGLDSIEAFEAVATLHELMGVRIPDDIDPKAFATIAKISAYLVKTYDADTVKAFVEMDVAARLAEMNDTSELS
jgi:acyl carrier protein